MSLGQVKVSQKTDKYNFPEIRICYGPDVEGITGTGTPQDLYGYEWHSVLDAANVPRHFKLESGVWVEKIPLEPFPSLPVIARHWSQQFDQAARSVIAWEQSEQLYIRQWDIGTSSWVLRGPFTGIDPVLFNDFELVGTTDNDIIMFYLSVDRLSIKYRIQRENYNTEHHLYSFVDTSILYYLDQAVIYNSSQYVLAIDTNIVDNRLYLFSAAYPRNEQDQGRFNIEPDSGIYFEVVIPVDVGQDQGQFNIEPDSGIYYPVVIEVNPQQDQGQFNVEPDSGVFYPVVIEQDKEDQGQFNIEPDSGIFFEKVIVFDPQANQGQFNIEPDSGAFVAI